MESEELWQFFKSAYLTVGIIVSLCFVIDDWKKGNKGIGAWIASMLSIAFMSVFWLPAIVGISIYRAAGGKFPEGKRK